MDGWMMMERWMYGLIDVVGLIDEWMDVGGWMD